MAEAFCPKHGPYDAAAGKCPYCSREVPSAPPPLDDEETWARPGRSEGAAQPGTSTRRQARAGNPGDDDEPTQFGKHNARAAVEAGEEPTGLMHEEKGLLGWLIVTDGLRRGHVYPVKQGSVIGKSKLSASIVIADDKVSSVHAKITVEDGRFVLWDFGSTNGTFVNGKRIREATPLSENDRIQLGTTRLILKVLEEETDSLS